MYMERTTLKVNCECNAQNHMTRGFSGDPQEEIKEGVCIGCGGRATKTNNTLCDKCWQDAEGENK